MDRNEIASGIIDALDWMLASGFVERSTPADARQARIDATARELFCDTVKTIRNNASSKNPYSGHRVDLAATLAYSDAMRLERQRQILLNAYGPSMEPDDAKEGE